MNVQLPPLFFYAVGAVLVLFGNFRVFHLGMRHTRREIAEDTPGRAKQRRYHVVVGAIFIAMGLFLVISTLMVPFQILVIPLFIEINFFGWQNSYAGLLMPGLLNAFGVFMMRQYAAELPDELIEAARVDGASEPYIFLRIILPLLGPALTSLGIIVFVWSWGAFLWPLVAVQDRSLYVLSIGLSGYVQPYNQEPMWGPAMAASTIATIPIACLFIFLQRYFIKGLTAAAVKG